MSQSNIPFKMAAKRESMVGVTGWNLLPKLLGTEPADNLHSVFIEIMIVL
jgi:hypothetical protein